MDDVKQQVAVANRVLAEMGLASGVLASLGHASMRVPSDPGKFVVKGRGYPIDALAKMAPEGMVICDLEGYKVNGPPGVSQCFEVKLHSCIYRARPDVQAIVHVHPRYTVVLSVLGATIAPMCNEGLALVRRPLPVYPHNMLILTEETGTDVARLLGDGKAVLLQGHGAVTAGASLGEAVMDMAHLEEQARMNWYAYCAAGPDHPRVSDALIEEAASQPPTADLPHFRDAVTTGRTEAAVGGAWRYYVDLVSQDL